MPKLSMFSQVTLDGYFTGRGGDMSWAYKDKQDAEWNSFVADNSKGGGVLLFGRVTYEMMASYWPTPLAAQNDPALAARMNEMPKVVFSRTLSMAPWSNTKLVKDDLVEAVRKMKKEPGKDMAILGSGTVVSQLARAGLIDEFQIVINPLALGRGRTLFEGLEDRLALKLTKTRAFANGNVLMCYQPTG